MSIIEEYWSGVLRRLQAEVDVFNRLVLHNGVMGQENELSLSRVLLNLVPRRYGVSAGLLIDSGERYSKQTDILIYDQAYEPAILAQSTQVLFPVENVRACIEVKTTVEKREIEDFARKMEALQELRPVEQPLPLFALVGYHLGSRVETIAENLSEVDPRLRPDIFCVLESALFGGWPKYANPNFDTPDQYLLGLALLQEEDEWLVPPVDVIEAFERNGTRYPVVDLGGKTFAADESRALLMFCEALVRYLAVTDSGKVPTMPVSVEFHSPPISAIG
jgi:hypothetical protein